MLVEFDSLFDLENSNDSLTFYDGPDTTHPLLYKVGGQKTPPSFRSTSSVITVVFHSDDGVNGAGFAFKYTIGKTNNHYYFWLDACRAVTVPSLRAPPDSGPLKVKMIMV